MNYNDKFTTTTTYTGGMKKKYSFFDFDKPFLEALSTKRIIFDNDEAKGLLKRFRTDFGIPFNHRPNTTMKMQWVDYYLHEH